MSVALCRLTGETRSGMQSVCLVGGNFRGEAVPIGLDLRREVASLQCGGAKVDLAVMIRLPPPPCTFPISTLLHLPAFMSRF